MSPHAAPRVMISSDERGVDRLLAGDGEGDLGVELAGRLGDDRGGAGVQADGRADDDGLAGHGFSFGGVRWQVRR